MLFEQVLHFLAPVLFFRFERLLDFVALCFRQSVQIFLQEKLAERREKAIDALFSCFDFAFGPIDVRFVFLALRSSADGDEPFFRLQPMIGIIGWPQNGLELIIFFLGEWLEFVIVAAGALHREAHEDRADKLNGPFQDRIAINTQFGRVAIAFARAVRRIAQKMSGDEQFLHFGRDIAAGAVAR